VALYRAEFEDFEGGRSQQAIVIVNRPIDPVATLKAVAGSIGWCGTRYIFALDNGGRSTDNCSHHRGNPQPIFDKIAKLKS
jgi:hypothetical protein